MGILSKKDTFSWPPIFRLGMRIHIFGAWLMGYRWGTDLYLAGLKYGLECAREQASMNAKRMADKDGE